MATSGSRYTKLEDSFDKSPEDLIKELDSAFMYLVKTYGFNPFKDSKADPDGLAEKLKHIDQSKGFGPDMFAKQASLIKADPGFIMLCQNFKTALNDYNKKFDKIISLATENTPKAKPLFTLFTEYNNNQKRAVLIAELMKCNKLIDEIYGKNRFITSISPQNSPKPNNAKSG